FPEGSTATSGSNPSCPGSEMLIADRKVGVAWAEGAKTSSAKAKAASSHLEATRVTVTMSSRLDPLQQRADSNRNAPAGLGYFGQFRRWPGRRPVIWANSSMSKRNTYLAGGAAIAAGVALIAIALVATSGDDGNGSTPPAAQQAAPDQDQPSPAGRNGAQSGSEQPAQDRSISAQLDRRHTVRAPALDLEVIEDGSAPAQARAPLEDAVADGSLSLEKLRDSPVVLYLWASDCGPCRADARLIEDTWQRWGRRGV